MARLFSILFAIPAALWGQAPPVQAGALPAAVIGVSEGITYVNRGANVGLRVGQTLQVYRVVVVPGLKDPETGQPLTRKKPVCKLTLSEVDERTSSGSCKGDSPAAQDGAELQDGGGLAAAEALPRAPIAAGNHVNDVEPPCAALADRALLAMRNPPAAWVPTVSTALRQIQSGGLNAYIQANGGVLALLATTRRDLTGAQRNGQAYGINLNQAWIDMLVCMSQPVRNQAPPDPPPAEPTLAPVAPPSAPPDEHPPDPVTVEVGQSTDQVVAILGQPQRTAKAGAKTIYFYKDLKITFTDGKVSDVQ